MQRSSTPSPPAEGEAEAISSFPAMLPLLPYRSLPASQGRSTKDTFADAASALLLSASGSEAAGRPPRFAVGESSPRAGDSTRFSRTASAKDSSSSLDKLFSGGSTLGLGAAAKPTPPNATRAFETAVTQLGTIRHEQFDVFHQHMELDVFDFDVDSADFSSREFLSDFQTSHARKETTMSGITGALDKLVTRIERINVATAAPFASSAELLHASTQPQSSSASAYPAEPKSAASTGHGGPPARLTLRAALAHLTEARARQSESEPSAEPSQSLPVGFGSSSSSAVGGSSAFQPAARHTPLKSLEVPPLSSPAGPLSTTSSGHSPLPLPPPSSAQTPTFQQQQQKLRAGIKPSISSVLRRASPTHASAAFEV